MVIYAAYLSFDVGVGFAFPRVSWLQKGRVNEHSGDVNAAAFEAIDAIFQGPGSARGQVRSIPWRQTVGRAKLRPTPL
jgi:hypothetical protein